MVEKLVRRAFFPEHSRLIIAVNQFCCLNEKVSIATDNMTILNERLSKTRYAHFIFESLKVNSFLPKTDEICFTAKQSTASK